MLASVGLGLAACNGILGIDDLAVRATADAAAPDAPRAPDAPGPDAVPGFPQPANTVPINFSVDDTANQVYASRDLIQKGGISYDPLTRIVIAEPSWQHGPWPPLYDDGGWDVGGHEPIGSVAGDHRLGITYFVAPTTAVQTFEYGLEDTTYENGVNERAWVWIGPNGSFQVAPGATDPVEAPGQVFPSFGTIDLTIALDTTALAPGTWDQSSMMIKGSPWAWVPVPMDGNATFNEAWFVLGTHVGQTNAFKHNGLLRSGDLVHFVLIFGANIEYKDAMGALATGVTASITVPGGAPVPVPITREAAWLTITVP
jgi:hypothetical protein